MLAAPKVRTREGTAGRLKNPARSTCPRTSTLRISHSRTRPADATPPLQDPERAATSDRSRTPVDNRGEPKGATASRVVARGLAPPNAGRAAKAGHAAA